MATSKLTPAARIWQDFTAMKTLTSAKVTEAQLLAVRRLACLAVWHATHTDQALSSPETIATVRTIKPSKLTTRQQLAIRRLIKAVAA